MLVKVKTIEQLKEEFFLTLRSNCGDKLTKIAPTSTINGLAYAMAKIVQKINKNAAQIEAKLFPEYASSTVLDDISLREGVPARYSQTKSSVVILFVATTGTVYPISTQAKSTSGIIFATTSELTIDTSGYGYVIAESTTYGAETNVYENTIKTLVATAPAGHTSLTNPMRAINGTDTESDYNFRNRIINSGNLFSCKTEAYFEALLKKQYPDVLKIYSDNFSSYIRMFNIYVVKNSLADFSSGELSAMNTFIQDYLPLSDKGLTKTNVLNITWTYIDVYVPFVMKAGYVQSEVMTAMQNNLASFLDLNVWSFGTSVQWIDLLTICRETEGVQEIVEKDFLPLEDIEVLPNSLPRFREFALYDAVSLIELGSNVTPAFWLKKNDYSFVSEVLL